VQVQVIPKNQTVEADDLKRGLLGRRLLEDTPMNQKSPPLARTLSARLSDIYFRMHLLAGADMPASSQQTQSLLRWKPTGPNLLNDIDQPGYYTIQ
jgi:hypothetical protein